jgi:hypothetical protein
MITCRRVANHSEMERGGDYFIVEESDYNRLRGAKDKIVVICCPFCGDRYELGIINHTIVSYDPLTVSPSVVNPERGCHFWIQNGVITKC